MSGINRAMLIGNLGSDPDVRTLNGGDVVCEFRLATSETWKDKNGERQERTEWHTVVCWGGLAESCGEYLSKGRQVYVEGRIQTREWEDKDGVKRWSTEINAQTVQFLGGDGKRDEQQQRGQSDDRGASRGREDARGQGRSQGERAGSRERSGSGRQSAPPATSGKKPWRARGVQ